MALTPASVIWITDKTGVVLEEYQGKYSIKAVQKYTSQGQEKVSYDWVRKEVWNKDTRQREVPQKVNAAMGVYLGDMEQAIKTLAIILRSFRDGTAPVEEDDSPPF